MEVHNSAIGLSYCSEWGCIPPEVAGLQFGGSPGFGAVSRFPDDGCGQGSPPAATILDQFRPGHSDPNHGNIKLRQL